MCGSSQIASEVHCLLGSTDHLPVGRSLIVLRQGVPGDERWSSLFSRDVQRVVAHPAVAVGSLLVSFWKCRSFDVCLVWRAES